MTCAIYGKENETVEYQPTKQLLFGGFPVRLEKRCAACEQKVGAWIDRILKKEGVLQ
jgi:hypothetical protein